MNCFSSTDHLLEGKLPRPDWAAVVTHRAPIPRRKNQPGNLSTSSFPPTVIFVHALFDIHGSQEENGGASRSERIARFKHPPVFHRFPWPWLPYCHFSDRGLVILVNNAFILVKSHEKDAALASIICVLVTSEKSRL